MQRTRSSPPVPSSLGSALGILAGAGWILGAACGGPDVVFRLVEVDLQGVSAAAAAVEIRFISRDGGPGCAAVDSDTVLAFEAESSARWTAGDPERSLTLPESQAGEGTLVAFTEDDTGRILQLGCRDLAYADVETPEVVVRLEPVL